MTPIPNILRTLCAAFASVCTVIAPAYGADWRPERNIELIIAATPGGGYDNLARPLQKILQERKLVDHSVLALYKPGAGGAIGWGYLNQRPSDRHVLSIISGTILGANIMGQMDLKSTGDAAIAVVGGHVDVLATRPSNVAELVKAGRLRTLAVTAPRRMAGIPDVPTWRELGVDAVYGNWFGMIGPRAMTAAQIEYWDSVFLRLARTDDWKRELERNLWSDFYMNSAQTRQFLDQQNEELRGLMTDIGLAR